MISYSARATPPWGVSQSSAAIPSTYGLSTTKTPIWQFSLWTTSQAFPTRKRAAPSTVAFTSRCHLICASRFSSPAYRLWLPVVVVLRGCFLRHLTAVAMWLYHVWVWTWVQSHVKDTAHATGYFMKRNHLLAWSLYLRYSVRVCDLVYYVNLYVWKVNRTAFNRIINAQDCNGF